MGRPWAALERHAALADPTSAGAQRLLWQVRLAEWAAASRNPSAEASLTSRVEAWLLEASRHLSRGEQPAARRAVQRALSLAAPEQLRRPFREATADVRRLLLEEQAVRPPARSARRPPARPDVAGDESAPDLVEQLTEKEREVLGHLAAMLSTDEIAAAMFVSVNTVRTHVRNILRKLGARRAQRGRPAGSRDCTCSRPDGTGRQDCVGRPVRPGTPPVGPDDPDELLAQLGRRARARRR